MDVALISDTHVPSRAAAIPEWVRERLSRADHVIHAGDVDSAPALATVEELASELTAVAGNMDRSLSLPSVATVTLGPDGAAAPREGVTFVVTHGTGSTRGYEDRVASTVRRHADEGPVVGVAGHTHEVLDTTHGDVRLLNPGSATGAAPASTTSMMTARVTADAELDVTVHER
jgi:putative phosphoesterase